MDDDMISERMILSVIMLAVFLVRSWINWSTADARYWTIMLSEAGLTPQEIGIALMFRSIVFGVVGICTSIGLLLLNYYLGKRYKLTKTSTIVMLSY